MMQVSRKVDYALRAVLYLSQLDEGQTASVKEIARQRAIPEKFLEKVLKNLLRFGLVRSRRGAYGGYVLARPAEQITFRDVIEAVEGPISLNVCVNEGHDCSALESCNMQQVWLEGQRRILEFFTRTTLADIAGVDAVNRDRAVGV